MTTYGMGLDDSGNFDQYSLEGVDFGENYDKVRDIKPTNLQGDYVMNYAHADFGVIPQGMGVVPSGMGVIPSGMGEDYQQLGHHAYQQLGNGRYQQLGAFSMQQELFKVGTFSVTYMTVLMALGAVAAGHYLGLYKLPLPIPQMK